MQVCARRAQVQAILGLIFFGARLMRSAALAGQRVRRKPKKADLLRTMEQKPTQDQPSPQVCLLLLCGATCTSCFHIELTQAGLQDASGAWKSAMARARGDKVLDNPALLKRWAQPVQLQPSYGMRTPAQCPDCAGLSSARRRAGRSAARPGRSASQSRTQTAAPSRASA